MELNIIHNENCLTGLKKLDDNSVDCCVTSPPYYGLRDYGTDDQIGLESTPEKFIESLVAVFTEVKRVLKPTGTLWLNIGDSYNGSGKAGNSMYKKKHTQFGKVIEVSTSGKPTNLKSCKPKDLIGIPWMAAFALRTAGYYLRQDIIWHKPNPMPESVTDRCTKAHEYIFLMSKSAKYYYDAEAIKTIVADATIHRMMQQIDDQKGSSRVLGKTNGTMKAVGPGRNARKGVDIKETKMGFRLWL